MKIRATASLDGMEATYTFQSAQVEDGERIVLVWEASKYESPRRYFAHRFGGGKLNRDWVREFFSHNPDITVTFH